MKNESINPKIIEAALANGFSEEIKVFYYKNTDSTNTRAKFYAENEKNDSVALFVAEEQSSGRGRFGRSFDSPSFDGLYFSLLIPKNKLPTGLELATPRAAVAVRDSILNMTGYHTRIKWVNDILAEEKKLCGILAEGVLSEDGVLTHIILGIGINVKKRSFPEELRDIATSLEDASGISVDRSLLCSEIVLSILSEKYTKDYILEEYRKNSAVIGQEITVRRLNGETFFAKCIGITDSGALSVEKENGEIENLISAEVSVKINNN